MSTSIDRLLQTPQYGPDNVLARPWNEFFRQTYLKSGALTILGEISSTTKIHGRVEGIGTTVQHVDNTGIIQAAGLDFTRAYVNKTVDNINDGAVYARPRGGQLVNGIVPVAYGKNMVPNPGFELNLSGTSILTDLALNNSVTDGWFVFSKNVGGATAKVFSPQLDNSESNSGKNSLLISVLPNTSLPAVMAQFEECRVVGTKIPVRVGDIVRVQAYERWDFTSPIPAGFNIIQRIGLLVFSASDVQLGELTVDNTNNQNASWVFKQGALQIPASLGGGVPAYARVQCSAFIQNTNGAPTNTPAGLCANLHWDDVYMVLQSTAFEVTPLNTCGTYTGNPPVSPLTQSGVSTTILAAASTMQFGDGQVAYSSGSVNPGVLGTFYVYADDPTYSGGAVTYVATTTPADTVASNGRIFIGKITTAGGGGGAGSGGGSGGGGVGGKAALQ